MLMDPAVNLMFLKMKSELKDVKEKLAQAQTDLSAWKFSTDRSVRTATVSIVRKRPVTNYCIDRCFMTTCLLYHIICIVCHMHHCSHELSLISLHEALQVHTTLSRRIHTEISVLFRLYCKVLIQPQVVSCVQVLHLCLCG